MHAQQADLTEDIASGRWGNSGGTHIQWIQGDDAGHLRGPEKSAALFAVLKNNGT